MSKKPNAVVVPVTVSNISFEVPKSLFVEGAIRAAVFVGRKGRGALTRHTKWFTVSDPSVLPIAAQHGSAAPQNSAHSRQTSSYITDVTSSTNVRKENGSEPTAEEVGDLVVLKFGDLSSVTYNIEMQPLNKFDGEWVFDQKLSHPLSLFVKVFVLRRPGVERAGNATEMDSSINEMLAMDREEMEDDDEYSNSESGNNCEDEALIEAQLEATQMGFTAEQLALLTGDERAENEIIVEKLIRRSDSTIVKRYLSYPRVIDVSAVVNTRSKSMDFCERVKCKSPMLMGSMLGFTVQAMPPIEKLEQFDEKRRNKEDKEIRKRREKEEKIVDKERKKRGKETKEPKDSHYGEDVGDNKTCDEAKDESIQTRRGSQCDKSIEKSNNKKSGGGFGPLKLMKSIFGSKEVKSQQVTPFAVKYRFSPFPFLLVLEQFTLKKITMAPEHYRAVHIRMGADKGSTNNFPLLLLDTRKATVKEETAEGFDGTQKTRQYFDFGRAHLYFADKQLRKVTGFDTIRSLREFEKNPRSTDEAIASAEAAKADEFQAQILNVGERFVPVPFETARYSANDAQALPTKDTRVIAQLVVPRVLTGVERYKSEEEERIEYLRAKKMEQNAAQKAEEDARKAQRTQSDIPDNKTEEVRSSRPIESDSEPNHVEDHNSDEGSKCSGDVEEKVDSPFESYGADHVDVSSQQDKKPDLKKPEITKAPATSDSTTVIANKTSSFQLSTYLINEEYIPKEGFRYCIRFNTGEELFFVAKRIFLPAFSRVGAGGSVWDTPLLLANNSSQ